MVEVAMATAEQEVAVVAVAEMEAAVMATAEKEVASREVAEMELACMEGWAAVMEVAWREASEAVGLSAVATVAALVVVVRVVAAWEAVVMEVER